MASHSGGKGKKRKPEYEKTLQACRTHKNKIKKYQKFLSMPHTLKQDKIWKEKLEHSLDKI